LLSPKVLSQQGFVIPKKNVNLNPQFENSRENEAHKEQQNVDVLKEKYAF